MHYHSTRLFLHHLVGSATEADFMNSTLGVDHASWVLAAFSMVHHGQYGSLNLGSHYTMLLPLQIVLVASPDATQRDTARNHLIMLSNIIPRSLSFP